MHPILLSFGSFSIRSYGAMAALGFVLGCWLVNVNRKYARMSSDQASTSLFVAMIAGTVQPKPSTMGRNALPDSPTFPIIPSIT